MKNYLVFRAEKIKSSSGVKSVLAEMLPEENSPRTSSRADISKSMNNKNSSLASEAFEDYKKLLPEKVRKNAVYGLNFIVSTSQEFGSELQEKNFYAKATNFISENFGSVVGYSIHRDEKSTHLHVVTIPLVDGKLNARELIGGSKNRLKDIQTDFFENVGKEFGLSRGEVESKAIHQTVERHHLKKEKELEKKEQVILQKENFLDTAYKITEKQQNYLNLLPKEQLIEHCKILMSKIKESAKFVKNCFDAPFADVKKRIARAEELGCKNFKEYDQLMKHEQQKRLEKEQSIKKHKSTGYSR